jgi:DNA-binding MarR family transcriptional regulator
VRAGGNANDHFQNSIFHLLRLVLQEHQSLWTARLADAGVQECTKPQYALLRSALAYPGLDQASAGQFTGTDKATVVSLVDRLEQRGLITRVMDPSDRRRRRLLLTPGGEALLALMIPVVEGLNDEFLSRLSNAERDIFLAILLKLTGPQAGEQPAGSDRADSP